MPWATLDAGVIVAVADGDFLASTYADQQLAPAGNARFQDRLLVWRRNGKAVLAEVDVSNSVASPPEVLAVSKDGRYAYVVERLGQRMPGDRRIPDLAAGRRLFAVDLAAMPGPEVASWVEVGPYPESIDLSPDGRMLAVVSNAGGRNLLQLVDVDGGRLAASRSFDLAELGLAKQDDGPSRPFGASGVYWHPDGRTLAVTVHTHDLVLFLRMQESHDAPRLVAWGPPVRTGRDPFVGRFTPDGRHFLSLDWGRDLAATTLEGRLPATPSRISVIRLAGSGPGSADATHRRLGDAGTDLSSEGIAVSPDGRLVAVASMRGTALSPASQRHTRKGSLMLFGFDPERGSLELLDRVEFDGVLPEGVAFDRSGRHLVATVFERRDCPGGALHVYGIEDEGARRRLAYRGTVTTPHGIHHVVIR